MLWHKCLGHISLERIKRLVKEEILRNIDFVDFNTCIECIKGKHTNKTMYLYLLYKKFEALDAFKVFKAEVEKQKEKKIKIIRSDKGGKYYGRYTKKGQQADPFAKFLQEEGIVSQYTMVGTPQQNGVVERRNRTLMETVRSKTNNTRLLPMSLYSEALKTTVYILNRVPSKVVPKIPFEIWYGWKPSLRHLLIWGC